MIVGITRLRADPLQRDHPRAPGDSVDIGLGIGYFVALLASLGLLAAGYLRQASTRPPQAAGRHLSVRPMDAAPKPDRNLAMELVRTTEYAALACARWIGRGDKEGADGAAVDAMRMLLDTVSMDGVVVIGEGEKDEAPMLYNGEQIGDGSPPRSTSPSTRSRAPSCARRACRTRSPRSRCRSAARCSTRAPASTC